MNEIILRGVKWLEFTPDPPSIDRITDNVWNGEITLGKKRTSRLIRARFYYQSDNFLDYKILRDELFTLLDPLKEFYTVDDEVPGKRWKVEIDSYNPERINGMFAEVAVTLYSAKSYAETIGTTLNPVWGYGMSLQTGTDIEDYVHDTLNFSVYNAGTEIIDPRESELLITLTSITASSTVLTITNSTTGDIWEYTGTYQSGDTITINRTKSKRNDLNIVGSTNLELITLDRGINNFVITGLTGAFEISFDFRYLYV